MTVDGSTLDQSLKNTSTATSVNSNSTGVKNVMGKFTTANFIETTIGPSPANFGNVSDKEKKGKTATTTTSMSSTLPESLSSSGFSSNSEMLENSKGSRSNSATSSKSSDRKGGKITDVKTSATDVRASEVVSKASDLGVKNVQTSNLRNGKASPDVAEKPVSINCHTTSSLFTATSKPSFSHSFSNFLSETATVRSQPSHVESTSTEAYDSEVSDTPSSSKRLGSK